MLAQERNLVPTAELVLDVGLDPLDVDGAEAIAREEREKMGVERPAQRVERSGLEALAPLGVEKAARRVDEQVRLRLTMKSPSRSSGTSPAKTSPNGSTGSTDARTMLQRYPSRPRARQQLRRST